MLREAFYYLLGGVTFLPLCVIGIFLHFYFNVPIEHQSASPTIDADVELTHEKKLAALDLAARNAAIHDEIEKAKGKDHPQGDATAPPAAKRLGAGPAASSAPKPFSSGWLTVRPTFEADKDAATATGAASSPAVLPASLVEGESDASQAHSEDESTAAESVDADKASSVAVTKPNGPNAGTGYMSQMYRGILDYRNNRAASKKPSNDAHARSKESASASGATPTGTAGKESFYCILKSPILYLYSSDDTANPNTECHAAIDLRGKRVSIFVAGLGDTLGDLDPQQPATTQATSADAEQSGNAPADPEAFDPSQAWKTAKRAAIRDGELFMKRNAIRIVGSALGRNSSSKRASKLSQKRPQWFIFCKNNYVMEDWYHALLQASLTPDPSLSTSLSENSSADPLSQIFAKLDDPIGPTFSQEDMASLLVSLDSFPDPLPLRWLNALVGRIFFSVYRTAWLEDYIVSKMMKKINRVKTPGFLNDIKVVEVDVGRRAPGFSRPMLKALTSEGEASMEVAVHYVGEVRITISCTLTLSLGSRFKPYTIPIVLAVVLRSLEGNLLLHVKRPPSNRLWFGFTTLPKMDIDVEPVVSERKVQWGMVTRLIESRIRELLTESIVVPNMDDISFFNTRSLPLRGGIFADAAKKTDLHRAESNGTSSTAATAAPSATVTPQSKDGKTSALSIKTSELLTADRVGTASAPVSGR
uniref:SMP-LTD domain-containing protein n=1 Tax=Kalmanozyma brasiliensis (strain GHG001) TaxID=1365824 RepID=V5EU86_KALBG